MIALLGSSGYIGSAFAAELRRRKIDSRPLSRTEIDYARFETLMKWLADERPEFVINAAGYTGKPNVDACESAKAETLAGNLLLPHTIAHACAAIGIPWGHVSSGCIYSGGKIDEGGGPVVEKDLMKPGIQAVWKNDRSLLSGYTEEDAPNFSFRSPPASFYSGSKALAEEAIAGIGRSYIWRLRIPFDNEDNSRNYISKLTRYERVYNNINSISHRRDFVRACLDLWEKRAPYGAYNVVNPGFVTSADVVVLIKKILKPAKDFRFWKDDEEFYRVAAKTPRSNCLLDTTKLTGTGVKMRPVEDALEESLRSWKPQTS